MGSWKRRQIGGRYETPTQLSDDLNTAGDCELASARELEPSLTAAETCGTFFLGDAFSLLTGLRIRGPSNCGKTQRVPNTVPLAFSSFHSNSPSWAIAWRNSTSSSCACRSDSVIAVLCRVLVALELANRNLDNYGRFHCASIKSEEFLE